MFWHMPSQFQESYKYLYGLNKLPAVSHEFVRQASNKWPVQSYQKPVTFFDTVFYF